MPIYHPVPSDMISLRNALFATGVITNEYYLTDTYYIFKTSIYPDKVFEFTLLSSTFRMYIGDSWTSGTSITNSIMILNSFATVPTGVTVAYNGALVFSEYAGSLMHGVLFDTVAESGQPICATFGNYDGTELLIRPGGIQLIGPSYAPLMDANGYYYTGDILVTNGGILTGKLANTKFISKLSVNVDSIQYGPHLYIPVLYTNGRSKYLRCSFLLENAA